MIRTVKSVGRIGRQVGQFILRVMVPIGLLVTPVIMLAKWSITDTKYAHNQLAFLAICLGLVGGLILLLLVVVGLASADATKRQAIKRWVLGVTLITAVVLAIYYSKTYWPWSGSWQSVSSDSRSAHTALTASPPAPQAPRLGHEELTAYSDDWSRPVFVPPGARFYLHEDGPGWVQLPSGKILEIGPEVIVEWPNIAGGQFRFRAKNKPIRVKVVWEFISQGPPE